MGSTSTTRSSASTMAAHNTWSSANITGQRFPPASAGRRCTKNKGSRTMPKTWRRSAFLLLVLVRVSFAGNAEPRRPTSPVGKEDQATVLVGAGDIADCKDLAGAEATAKLLDKISGTVMAVGDHAYPDRSKEKFVCYGKTWGRAKTRHRPAANMKFTAAE